MSINTVKEAIKKEKKVAKEVIVKNFFPCFSSKIVLISFLLNLSIRLLTAIAEIMDINPKTKLERLKKKTKFLLHINEMLNNTRKIKGLVV